MVPNLRFKEFTNKWCESLLGNLVDIKSGNSPSTYELSSEGDYPFVKVEDMNNCTKYQIDAREYVINSQFCFPAGSIIFPKRGAAIMNNKVRILNQNSCADTNMMALIATDIKPEFLYYLINLIGLYKIADTSTIPQINNKHILPFKVNIPSEEEQTKIADFLSSVDEKITLLNKKYDLLCQYKKGMMQKIFSQEVRFKDENGEGYPEWKYVDLKEIASKVNIKNREGLVNVVLTNSATQGIVRQDSYFERDIVTESNLEGYYVVSIGDFIYNPRISATAPVGPIKMNELIQGVMSPLYTVFRFKRGLLKFYQYFFESSVWHDYMKSVANSGARHDRMNISGADFFGLPVPQPFEEEQTKIANFLSALDDKIAVKKAELDKLKTWKQGLLQQMFV
ncbi:restriction endonuclease subunit S [Cronobacter sakazakii]|uniref:restriction endonuclease subunit S n=1 Tax=Cronobacter sakazakii TaxID=28141 RepID=UPI001ED982B5|nr:restriction endonuclease subunit S [Cronobacter sakazakii]